MARKVNLFYVSPIGDYTSFGVYHRQVYGEDKECAVFHFGSLCTVSKTRALKAAKVFCKQMNTYYPTKIDW